MVDIVFWTTATATIGTWVWLAYDFAKWSSEYYKEHYKEE